MKKIDEFTITSLTLSGFKCFEQEERFDFGDVTFVSGHNGKGKTSLADAIAYAFTGMPFFGDRGLDRLHNQNSAELSVTAVFTDQNGVSHTLRRSRKNDVTGIEYDGYRIRQKDIEDIFGERDVFLSIFNPLYFIESLGEAGKALLERLLPQVTHDEILAMLSDGTRTALENEPLFSPETYLKNRRNEIRDLEKDVVYMQGQIDLLTEQEKGRCEKLTLIEDSLNGIESEITNLETIRDNGRDKNKEAGIMESAKQERDALIAEKENTLDLTDMRKSVRDTELDIEKRRLSEYKSKFADAISQSKAELDALYAEHGKLNKLINGIMPGIKCPACLRTITDGNISAVKTELQASIKEVTQKGKDKKAQLTEILGLDEQAKSQFEEWKSDDLIKLRSQLDACLHELTVKDIEFTENERRRTEKISELEANINRMSVFMVYGRLTSEQASQLENLYKQKEEFSRQIDTIKNDTSNLVSELTGNVTAASKRPAPAGAKRTRSAAHNAHSPKRQTRLCTHRRALTP